jgi:hypothetical protein
VFTPVVCDDNDACTIDSCDEKTKACVSAPNDFKAEFDELDKCTSGFCAFNAGFKTSPVVCTPSSRCKCDLEKGCVCKDGFLPGLDTKTKALGGAGIAAVVVGSAAAVVAFAVGGKKGMDYYRLRQEAATSVGNNPLYESNDRDKFNPLYTENTDA